MAEAGSPAQVIHQALLSYFPDSAEKNVVYIDAPYNFYGLDEAEAYRGMLEAKLSRIAR